MIGRISAAGALALVAAATAAPSTAQTAVHSETGLPFCGGAVQDRCIQKVDLRREGKPVTTRKAG